ncbi:MAG: diaminopimelate decarboxylase [Firmicutes bacterium]|nr:diaminopimelate decarboxylase [Bacillota bacterium]
MENINESILKNPIYEVRAGVLFFDGCNTVELAQKYGTPLYLMSETEIVRRIDELRKSFVEPYVGKTDCRIVYASKAFCTIAMMNICEREGISVDVVSGGELHTAKAAGFPADRIEFNGNNKTREEIESALLYGVGRFIVDGLSELKIIESVIADNPSITYHPKILFRITPGVTADTHDHLKTAKKDSKFGIPLAEEVFFPQIERAINSELVDYVGLHFHIGSQLFDVKPYLDALEIALEKVREIKERYGFVVSELNVGGGFGACYVDEDRKQFGYFLAPVVEKIIEFYDNVLGTDPPEISIEPGRSIVAEAGATLYTVGQTKDIPGGTKYISVDGGMGDNIRPSLYQAEYFSAIANKMDSPCDDTVTICGKNCESGDILIRNAQLPLASSGDILCTFSTGAYCYSMSSNYNGNLIPAVVLCSDGKDKLIVKRQTNDQLVQNQLPL